MKYDNNNIFAKIIRKELDSDIFFEDEFCVAIKDISPSAEIHYLVLPKGEYVSFNDFISKADSDFVASFFSSVKKVAQKLGMEEDGYRIVFNHGKNANQTVFHFHVHILGGQQLGGL